VGLFSLILVVVFWVGSSFLTKRILADYDKPFMMCYLTNLSFLLYFIFLVVEDPVKRLEKSDTNNNPKELPPFTKREIARIAFVFFALYLASNYATNIAFGATSVGSASILASTCGFFTLLFGWLVRVEVLSLFRVLAVFISVGGVLLLGIPEFSSQDTRTLGNSLALVGAVLYGVYSIFLKKVSIDESRISMPLLFAFGGLYTLGLAWIVLLGLHVSGVEMLEWPSQDAIKLILINVFLGGFIPNYLWNVAFVCTSPLVVAIGISFNIPLTLLVEYLTEGTFHAYRTAAGVCVVVGFIIVNLSSIYPQWDLAAERVLVKAGIMQEGDAKSTEERAAQLRAELIERST
jgi:solute carrier family 35 protein F5